MSDLTILLIASLAVFRLAELIVVDRGPWAIFEKLRKCSSHPMFCELVNCQYCAGIWLAFFATIYLGATERILWQDSFPWLLAIAGGQVAIMRTVRERK